MDRESVNIVTWNINGCGSPIKRKKILTYFKMRKAYIAFMQETHFRGEKQALNLHRIDRIGLNRFFTIQYPIKGME